MAEYRNLGRKRKRALPAHRRATEDVGWQSLRFSSSFWFGIGCGRWWEGAAFLVKVGSKDRGKKARRKEFVFDGIWYGERR